VIATDRPNGLRCDHCGRCWISLLSDQPAPPAHARRWATRLWAIEHGWRTDTERDICPRCTSHGVTP
jgi:hypothetical protein